jgi:DNA polymerase-1
MLNAFRNGIDLHALTAATVAGKPLESVTKQERQKAKALNFGLLFGLGVDKYVQYAKLSYGVNVTYEEADESIRTWRELYSRYREYQLAQALEGETTLRVRTPMGKLRALDPGNTYGTAMNHPVQGGAAECMLFALIALNKMFTDNNLDARLVNCVHDEVVVEAREDLVEEVKHCIETAMVSGFLRVFPEGITRDLVEVGLGYSWAEAKKKPKKK